ncbi:MAG TPA: hypothetical protein VGK45_00340 [Thermoanaerobaculia bacterium]|jgi:hypothetical protein
MKSVTRVLVVLAPPRDLFRRLGDGAVDRLIVGSLGDRIERLRRGFGALEHRTEPGEAVTFQAAAARAAEEMNGDAADLGGLQVPTDGVLDFDVGDMALAHDLHALFPPPGTQRRSFRIIS